jgi:hypothetical protein
LPSAVWEIKELITTGSKVETSEVESRWATSRKREPRVVTIQTAEAISASDRIRRASLESLACSSLIKANMARSKPMRVMAEINCRSFTIGTTGVSKFFIISS